MKRFFYMTLVMALCCLVPSQLAATTLTHAGAQVEITVPDTWKSNQDGDVITITAPDDAMSLVFMILNPKEADKALEEVDNELEKTIGTIKWDNEGNSKPEEINGMKGEFWGGTAKEGKFQVECYSLDTPSGKKLGVYWFDTPESEKKYEKDIETIVKGLKPMAKK